MCQADPSEDLSAVGAALKGTVVIRGLRAPRRCRCASSTRARTRPRSATARSSSRCATPSDRVPAARTRRSSAASATGRCARRVPTSSCRGGVVTDCGIGLTAVGAEHFCRTGGRGLPRRQGADRGEPRQAAARLAADSCDPNSDQRGPVDYKKHLAKRTHPACAAPRRPSQPGSLTMQVTITINGDAGAPATSSRACCSCTSSATSAGLRGTHWGCDTSNCGACTLWVDGEPVKSCTMLAAQADGHEVTHGRGPGEGRRARPGPAGLHRVPRPPVRLLHPGHDDDGALAARRQPAPVRGRRSARRSPARSAGAPATRTSSRRSSGPPTTPPRSEVTA